MLEAEQWAVVIMGAVGHVGVDQRACVRCAACVVIAPSIFALDRKGTRVLRQPQQEEARTCRAAALVCPTRAITVSEDTA